MTMIQGGPANAKRRFQMREKALSIGDDYWIEDESGNKVYKVNGKAARVRDTWILEDPHGNEVAQIREKKLSVRDKIKIEFGEHEAVVKKQMISIRDKFEVDVENGPDLEVKGKIGDHEYKIERDGKKIAEVSKKWFKLRDTYGIEIDPEEDDVLILAAAVCLEEMSQGVVD